MGDNFDQVSQQLSRRSPNKQDAIHQVAEENDILRGDDIECESNLSTSNISDSGSNSSSNGLQLDTSSKAATHWDLPPPPADSFPTYELAKSSAHEWARLHGYDFSVKKVCKNKDGKIHRRSLVCTRGGKLDNKRKLTEETRIRKRRGSKKGGCEVQIWLAADDINEPEGPWSIRHAGGTRSTWHNHPGAHKTDLPGHRQRAQKKRHVDDFIRQHRAARIKPQQSLAIIQQQMPDLPIVLDDVRNARSCQRREFVDTHTPAEAAILLLDQHGFYKDFVVGEDSRIKRLFFADKKSTELLKRWPDVFILDCTYNLNKYNLPILNIVAASCLNKTIQVGLCFLSGESEEDYLWAIEAIKKFLMANDIRLPRLIITDRDLALMNALECIIPETQFLLCRWHFNKDMLAYARTHVDRQVRNLESGQYQDHESVNEVMGLFWACVDADTEDDFNKACKSLERESSVCAKYLDRFWWPYKDKLVLAWTKNYPHFGEQVSSRAEGQHHRIKDWLGSSRNDLLGFLEACLPFFHCLYSEHTYLWSQQSISLAWAYRKEIFVYVTRIISNYALGQVDQQYTLARDELGKLRKDPQVERSKCKCIFRTVHGYPCKHDLMDLIEKEEVLKPEMFHKHWWLDPGVTVEDSQRVRILEPNAIRQKRMEARKLRRKGKSTQRVPSHFERVDKNHPASRSPSENLPTQFEPVRQVRDLPNSELIQVPASQPLMRQDSLMRTPVQEIQHDFPPPPALQANLQPWSNAQQPHVLPPPASFQGNLPQSHHFQQHILPPPSPFQTAPNPYHQLPHHNDSFRTPMQLGHYHQLQIPHSIPPQGIHTALPSELAYSGNVLFERAWKPSRLFHHVAYSSFGVNGSQDWAGR